MKTGRNQAPSALVLFFPFCPLLKFNGWLLTCHMSTTRPGSFLSRNNLFSVLVQVQFILNELNLSYFLTPEMLVRNLVPRSHQTLVTPKIVKNSTISEFDENFMGN